MMSSAFGGLCGIGMNEDGVVVSVANDVACWKVSVIKGERGQGEVG